MSTLLIYVSIFKQFYYCSFVIYSLKLKSMVSPSFFLILKFVLDIPGDLNFYTNFRMIYSIYVKNAMSILIGIPLNL